MAFNSFLNVHAEVISLIFSFLIFEANDFSSFAKLLLAWEWKRDSAEIKFVLEKLDWERLYHYHQHPMEVTRDQFLGFVGYSVKHNVFQALFFNSTQMLFMHRDVNHHLTVLSSLSVMHFPSRFSSLLFRTIFRPYERSSTSLEMFEIFSTSLMKSKIEHMLDLLQDIYEYLFEIDYLLPPFNLCPNAGHRSSTQKLDSQSNEEEFWETLCLNGVVGVHFGERPLNGRRLREALLWNTECDFCRLQLILYKVLLGVVRK